ncbi:hypothetical protein CLOM_g16459 [Closterium sp. NIES-68]|nr:hypothetical protein CLOM_g16459 [Closterium sp. NIES-68]
MDGFDDNPFATGDDAQPFVAGGGTKPTGRQIPVDPFAFPPKTRAPVKTSVDTSSSVRITDAKSVAGNSNSYINSNSNSSGSANSARSSAIPEDWLDSWTGSGASPSKSTFAASTSSASEPPLQSQDGALAAAQLAMGFLQAVQGASGVGGGLKAGVSGVGGTMGAGTSEAGGTVKSGSFGTSAAMSTPAAAAAAAGTRGGGTAASEDPFAFLESTPLGVTRATLGDGHSSNPFQQSQQPSQQQDNTLFDSSPFVASSLPLFSSNDSTAPPDPDLASDPFWTSLSAQPPSFSSQPPIVTSGSTLAREAESAPSPFLDLLGEPLVELTGSNAAAAGFGGGCGASAADDAATAGTATRQATAESAETTHPLARGPAAERSASAAAATAYDLAFLESLRSSPAPAAAAPAGGSAATGAAGGDAGAAGAADVTADATGSASFDGFGDFSDLGLPAVVVPAAAAKVGAPGSGASGSGASKPTAAAAPSASAPLFPAFTSPAADIGGKTRSAGYDGSEGIAEKEEDEEERQIRDVDIRKAAADVTISPVLTSSPSAEVLKSSYISLPPIEYYGPAGRFSQTMFAAPVRMPVEPNRPIPLVVCPKPRGEARAEVRGGEGRGREAGKGFPTSGSVSGGTGLVASSPVSDVSSSGLSPVSSSSSLTLLTPSSSTSLLSPSASLSSAAAPAAEPAAAAAAATEAAAAAAATAAAAAASAVAAEAAAAAAEAANLTGPDAGGKSCLLVAVGNVTVCVTDDGIRAWDMRQAMLPEVSAAENVARGAAAGAAAAVGAAAAGTKPAVDTAATAPDTSNPISSQPKGLETAQASRPLKPRSRLGSDAAPFVFVPFRGLAARAKSVASDDRLGVVFTGHKDGRVLVWRVQTGGGGNGGGGLGIRLHEPRVMVTLVADWQAHTATVTALVITPYGELWSSGDRGVIKAWTWVSLSHEIHRAMQALKERNSIAPDSQQHATSALPVRINPACVELRHRASASGGEQARNNLETSSAGGYGVGGMTALERSTCYDSDAKAPAFAPESTTSLAVTPAVTPVTPVTSAVSGVTSVSAGRGAVRMMVADAANGWVWAAGPNSACIWDARRREVIRALSSLSDPSASEEPSRALPPRVDSPSNNRNDVSSDVNSSGSSAITSTTGSNARDRRMEGAWKLLAKSREVLGRAKGAVTDAVRAAAAASKGEEYLSESAGGFEDSGGNVNGGTGGGAGGGGGGGGKRGGSGERGSGGSNTLASASAALGVSGGSLRKLQAAAAVGDGSVWFGFRSGALVRIDRFGARVLEVGLEGGVCCLCVVGLRLWVGMADGGMVVLGARNGRRLGGWPGVQRLSRKQQREYQQSQQQQQYQQQQQQNQQRQQQQQYQQQQQQTPAAAAAVPAAAATPAAAAAAVTGREQQQWGLGCFWKCSRQQQWGSHHHRQHRHRQWQWRYQHERCSGRFWPSTYPPAAAFHPGPSCQRCHYRQHYQQQQ